MVPTLAMVSREAGRKEENVKFPLAVTWPKLFFWRFHGGKTLGREIEKSRRLPATRRAKSSRSLNTNTGSRRIYASSKGSDVGCTRC